MIAASFWSQALEALCLIWAVIVIGALCLVILEGPDVRHDWSLDWPVFVVQVVVLSVTAAGLLAGASAL